MLQSYNCVAGRVGYEGLNLLGDRLKFAREMTTRGSRQ